jgi:hypothetical protein
VPGSVGAQEQALRAALGFVPYYVRKIERGGPRRMTVHLLLERLIPPGVDGDARNKMLAAWAMAHRLGNRTLASHFAFLADRVGVTLPELQDALVPPSSPDASARAAALALAHESAGASATVPAPVIEGLSAMHTPAGIVELLVVISTVAALHRYTITFPPEGLEREVEDFVSEAGADLDVPPV